jgi:hypothetical protein
VAFAGGGAQHLLLSYSGDAIYSMDVRQHGMSVEQLETRLRQQLPPSNSPAATPQRTAAAWEFFTPPRRLGTPAFGVVAAPAAVTAAEPAEARASVWHGITNGNPTAAGGGGADDSVANVPDLVSSGDSDEDAEEAVRTAGQRPGGILARGRGGAPEGGAGGAGGAAAPAGAAGGLWSARRRRRQAAAPSPDAAAPAAAAARALQPRGSGLVPPRLRLAAPPLPPPQPPQQPQPHQQQQPSQLVVETGTGERTLASLALPAGTMTIAAGGGEGRGSGRCA